MVFALLLAQDETLRNAELSQVRQSSDPETYDAVSSLFIEVGSLHSTIKFCLVDLCIPTLRLLSLAEYDRFRRITDHLVASDHQVNLFEFALLRVIHRHLDIYFRKERPPRIRYRRFEKLSHETAILLSTLAAMSHPDDSEAIREAFQRALKQLSGVDASSIPFLSGEACGLQAIEKALAAFHRATPAMKRLLLEAAAASVLADEAVSSREAELIRAMADAIGCPIPPFVRTAPLT